MEKGTSGGLDWTGNIKVYLVACYDDGSESLPGHYFNTFAGTTSANYFGDVGGGSTLKMEVIFKPQSVSGLKCFDDERINGARLYYTHSEEGFETFWSLYEKPIGKKIAKQKFLSLSLDDCKKAISVAPIYVKATPDRKFRKHASTWLNQECFNDEYDESTQGISSGKLKGMVL